ncbi:DUF1028 domain-containing protein [Candidatus Thorarchaeota archaeon]|nr:MAG: DUF1028 domain-containing protein [Candidatus Thorarchaeota archaeon]
MTFSIVAIDQEKREVGFAIASCVWDAGIVCSAKCEVGAIASQAQGNLQFLHVFFQKLGEKLSLERTLDHFKTIDDQIESRQIGMVTFGGETLAFTGKKCTPWAGHRIGKNYACQGNILTGPEVIENMVEAFESSEGMLAERLYAALQSGDDAGGDRRGKVSARILVEKKRMGVFNDTFLDINVEAHNEPVKEVGRILDVGKHVYRAWLLMRDVSKSEEGKKIGHLEKLEQLIGYREESAFIDFFSFLGDEYLKLGQRKRAMKYYQRVLRISPGMKDLYKIQRESNEMPADVVDELLNL